MRRKSIETRQNIIDAAYTLFYQNGFINTGVDDIADAAGITKRTLYQHFGSKDELIEVVLAHQHQIALERIRLWADCLTGNPDRMVRTLFDKFTQWVSATGWQGSGFTRAAVEFADLPGHPARIAAHRQKNEVERVLVKKFREQGMENAETLVRGILLLIEGCQSLVLIHENHDYIDVARQAALTLIGGWQRPS